MQCADALVPGGVFYCEDFFEAEHFTEAEQAVLAHDVAAPNLFDLLTYKRAFAAAGLAIERVRLSSLWLPLAPGSSPCQADIMSAEWTEYTRARVERWKAQREELVRVHRHDTYSRLLDFYEKVCRQLR